ncbi:uncharacterized protein BDR25DRAFT_352877 [Lindgomyces ingoldianus]|uniref:Uncharacterized protein n=1 Tax=Lindgomyces ingoldianus TaxID=673940 RepID=A0ACB6R2H9_9PLEO|nr:uncharacterized protein BDR25DRAFT_352877 [Lindgomyces ingoldianus]KAF2473454.1 hypothetical protein BDR25DRAFT_352877 [Lindgomyces ingoldianus]
MPTVRGPSWCALQSSCACYRRILSTNMVCLILARGDSLRGANVLGPNSNANPTLSPRDFGSKGKKDPLSATNFYTATQAAANLQVPMVRRVWEAGSKCADHSKPSLLDECGSGADGRQRPDSRLCVRKASGASSTPLRSIALALSPTVIAHRREIMLELLLNDRAPLGLISVTQKVPWRELGTDTAVGTLASEIADLDHKPNLCDSILRTRTQKYPDFLEVSLTSPRPLTLSTLISEGVNCGDEERARRRNPQTEITTSGSLGFQTYHVTKTCVKMRNDQCRGRMRRTPPASLWAQDCWRLWSLLLDIAARQHSNDVVNGTGVSTLWISITYPPQPVLIYGKSMARILHSGLSELPPVTSQSENKPLLNDASGNSVCDPAVRQCAEVKIYDWKSISTHIFRVSTAVATSADKEFVNYGNFSSDKNIFGHCLMLSDSFTGTWNQHFLNMYEDLPERKTSQRKLTKMEHGYKHFSQFILLPLLTIRYPELLKKPMEEYDGLCRWAAESSTCIKNQFKKSMETEARGKHTERSRTYRLKLASTKRYISAKNYEAKHMSGAGPGPSSFSKNTRIILHVGSALRGLRQPPSLFKRFGSVLSGTRHALTLEVMWGIWNAFSNMECPFPTFQKNGSSKLRQTPGVKIESSRVMGSRNPGFKICFRTLVCSGLETSDDVERWKDHQNHACERAYGPLLRRWVNNELRFTDEEPEGGGQVSKSMEKGGPSQLADFPWNTNTLMAPIFVLTASSNDLCTVYLFLALLVGGPRGPLPAYLAYSPLFILKSPGKWTQLEGWNVVILNDDDFHHIYFMLPMPYAQNRCMPCVKYALPTPPKFLEYISRTCAKISRIGTICFNSTQTDLQPSRRQYNIQGLVFELVARALISIPKWCLFKTYAAKTPRCLRNHIHSGVSFEITNLILDFHICNYRKVQSKSAVVIINSSRNIIKANAQATISNLSPFISDLPYQAISFTHLALPLPLNHLYLYFSSPEYLITNETSSHRAAMSLISYPAKCVSLHKNVCKSSSWLNTLKLDP